MTIRRAGRSPARLAYVVLLFILGLCLAAGFVLTLLGSRITNIYRVCALQLTVREGPSTTAPEKYILETGRRVYGLGEEVRGEGFDWIRISYLNRPEGMPLHVWMEGWVTKDRGEGAPFVESETNPLHKAVFLFNKYKRKLGWVILNRVEASPSLRSVERLVFIYPDKMLHAVTMGLLGIVSFLFFLGARFLPVPALIGSIVTTNVIGLFIELIDYTTKQGSFELTDMAANAMGSSFALLPFFLAILPKILYGRIRRTRNS